MTFNDPMHPERQQRRPPISSLDQTIDTTGADETAQRLASNREEAAERRAAREAGAQPLALPDPHRHERMVGAAVWLAERGFKVGWGRADAGKGAVRHWKSDMTDDPALVPGRLGGARNALIIPTGRLLVLDIDQYGWHKRLRDEAGLRPTFTVTTPTQRTDHESGLTYQGRHLYLRVEEGVSMSRVPSSFAGGEVRRSENGYVVGPHSRTATGVYVVDDRREVAVVGGAFIDYLLAHPKASPFALAQSATGGRWQWEAQHGSRHDWMRDMIRGWRGGDDDIESLVRRAKRYMDLHGIPRVGGDGRVLDDAELRSLAQGAVERFDDDRPEPGGGNGGSRAGPFLSRTNGLVESLAAFRLRVATLTDPPYLIENIAAVGSLTLWSGLPKSLKSLAVLDGGTACVQGRTFIGLKTQPARFVYVVKEMSDREVEQRIARLEGAGGLPDGSVFLVREPGLRLTVEPGMLDLWREVLDAIPADGPPLLMAIDPLRDYVRPGASLNEDTAAAEAKDVLRQLLAHRPAMGIVAVHHNIKSQHYDDDRNMAGSGALSGMGDYLVQWRRKGQKADEAWADDDADDALVRVVTTGPVTGRAVSRSRGADDAKRGWTWNPETGRFVTKARLKERIADCLRAGPKTVIDIAGEVVGDTTKPSVEAVRTTLKRAETMFHCVPDIRPGGVDRWALVGDQT